MGGRAEEVVWIETMETAARATNHTSIRTTKGYAFGNTKSTKSVIPSPLYDEEAMAFLRALSWSKRLPDMQKEHRKDPQLP